MATSPVKLNSHEIAWLGSNGPFPFVCNQGFIDWPTLAPKEVIDSLSPIATSASYASLVLGKFKAAHAGVK